MKMEKPTPRDCDASSADEFVAKPNLPETAMPSAAPFGDGPDLSSIDLSSMLDVDVPNQFNSTLASGVNPLANASPEALNYYNHGVMATASHYWAGTNPLWSQDQYSASMPQLLPQSTTSSVPDANKHSPHSSTGAPTYSIMYEHPHKDFDAEVTSMYHQFVGNPSYQTLTTTASSEAEQPNLMTPPDDTPPMPWMAHEPQRRVSDSSDLANNFDTFHLHQSSQSDLGSFNATCNLSPVLSGPQPTGMPTPQISPDQAATKRDVPGLDLASRRKAQRPTPLRADTSQNGHHQGPSTLSPRSRTPSVGFAFRRIQSTGNNLNILNGRVQKRTGSTSAQMSPRNIQTHIDARSVSATHLDSSQPISSATFLPSSPAEWQPTTSTGFVPSYPAQWQPTSPAALIPSSPAHWQHQSPYSTTSDIPEQNFSQGTPYPSSFPDLPTLAPGPHHIYSHLPSTQLQQSASYQPPLSAPPHKSSFFESPAGHATIDASSGADIKNPTPSVPRPGGHATHSSCSGAYPLFAPKTLSHQDGFSCFESNPPMPSYAPAPVRNEFKIEIKVGPQPKLPSTAETYSFSNSTPKDFSKANVKK